ncbi:aldehyde dehydrogenase family protein [Halopseudomonas formosensis]|jgi:aldehyde dehydrogenase (NAD+)|uniref:Aldehyde dehydrogenase family protein n=1 Tax=Halopseudomonas formosensis TaxID=1002526 RepID=A0ABU5C1R7_9GAMM|nr:aldehyde dehydrogenase family protein [Halopseudomonas formosensis]MDX9688593.1 aldehyde dehydrogenase family protein [Halopseudomonas formosensis]
MSHEKQFYINGQWVEPSTNDTVDVINPATEEVVATIALGGVEDVNAAVAAARAAFESYSRTSREERIALLERILEIYQRRSDEFARAITLEMGAPAKLSKYAQAPSGTGHFAAALKALKHFEFEERIGNTLVVKEPIGVCGLITPWNWPINQLACKIAPALATGCTMVLKPSEVAPLSALLLAEVLDEAGVPAGVFNLVNGDGPTVGSAMSAHPDIDMMSFTGSTGAGRQVMKNGAETIKRVALELGGKSANILLDDVNFEKMVAHGVMSCMNNTGQSCNAPTRMLVPNSRMDEVAEIAKAVAAKVKAGAPDAPDTTMGPVVSKAQWNKIQDLIAKGIEEGARLVVGGTGRPEGLDRGYYVKPTVFSHVTNDMTIAREEIFGPVLSIIGYENEADAIRIANDTRYGLSGYVSSADLERARNVARQIRTGMVHLNGAPLDNDAPFGGYKESGNGREWGHYGFEDFLEVKSIFGYYAEG